MFGRKQWPGDSSSVLDGQNSRLTVGMVDLTHGPVRFFFVAEMHSTAGNVSFVKLVKARKKIVNEFVYCDERNILRFPLGFSVYDCIILFEMGFWFD